jgi:hypothetical protein
MSGIVPGRDRVELPALFPYHEGETPEAWTNRVLQEAGKYGTYRQCSIGWHGECSQRREGRDAECLCLCHVADLWTVVGYWAEAIDGEKEPVVAGVLPEQHKVFGGADGQVWAEWVFAETWEQAEQAALVKAAGGVK